MYVTFVRSILDRCPQVTQTDSAQICTAINGVSGVNGSSISLQVMQLFVDNLSLSVCE